MMSGYNRDFAVCFWMLLESLTRMFGVQSVGLSVLAEAYGVNNLNAGIDV